MPYAEHHRKEKQREADKRYRQRHQDRLRERDKKWRLENPVKRKAQKRRNYERHREEILCKKKDYYPIASARRMCRMRNLTAEQYAQMRAGDRLKSAIRCVNEGRSYVPRFARRIPDWAVFGQRIVDGISLFLRENITESQIGWLKERKASSAGQ